MWHDVETSTDLLNFSVVADTAAQLIRDSGGEPLSIGISGSWGVGKSSLVKMVAESLKKTESADKKYIFLDFNAWLYQGYDDARMALLQSVSDKLIKEAEDKKGLLEKATFRAKCLARFACRPTKPAPLRGACFSWVGTRLVT